MREGGDRARFALEAGERIRPRREISRQNLDRDVASQLRVARAIHRAPPARPERRDVFVRTEARAGR